MSSDGEGRARSSASPAKRGNPSDDEGSQSPSGQLGGNLSDNDAGSDAGNANDGDEDLFGSESDGGEGKYVTTEFNSPTLN